MLLTSRATHLLPRALYAALFVIVLAVIALAQSTPERLVIDQSADHDTYAAQRDVHLKARIDGDFVAAGQTVTVDGDVAGDVLVAAQNIEINAQVGDDVRAAGQHVKLMAPVAGHVVAAGQSVTLTQPVGDWASLSGSRVSVLGSVGGDLDVRANGITIDGEVAGNVDLTGGQLEFGPNALVLGDVTWRSHSDAQLRPGARIEGELIQTPPPDFVDELKSGRAYSLPLKTIVAALVLFLLFSRALRASAVRIETSPWVSLLLGLAVFCITPFLVIGLFASGIGAGLGVAVLLAYLALLMVGVLTGLYTISDLALRRWRSEPVIWQSLAAIAVTVIAVALVSKIPWVGALSVIGIWLLGLGALCWNGWSTLRGAGARPQ